MSHSGHEMGDTAADPACKISMLWNWYTVDACFLASSWHIRDKGMFAASCIGVALLVVCLEALRRIGKEYDAYLLRAFHRHAATLYPRPSSATSAEEVSCCAPKASEQTNPSQQLASLPPNLITFRASPFQQFVRSLIHMATFGVGYILMLLAMYFNGFIIISIFIGAFFGKFLCDWMIVKISLSGIDDVGGQAKGIEEPTVCCG